MNNLKNDYENIKAPERLRKKVNTMMKREMMKNRLYKAGATAAAVLLVCAAALNIMPGVAYAAMDIPVIGSVVKVLTFNRFEFKDGHYEANITTPQIEGLLDKELEDRLNAELKDHADTLINEFEKEVATMKADYGDANYAVEADYLIKTDDENILAIDFYTFTAMASSDTKHSFYTIDKATGSLLSLEGLFQSGADYITPITTYITGEMERLNTEAGAAFFTGEEGLKAIRLEIVHHQHI